MTPEIEIAAQLGEYQEFLNEQELEEQEYLDHWMATHVEPWPDDVEWNYFDN